MAVPDHPSGTSAVVGAPPASSGTRTSAGPCPLPGDVAVRPTAPCAVGRTDDARDGPYGAVPFGPTSAEHFTTQTRRSMSVHDDGVTPPSRATRRYVSEVRSQAAARTRRDVLDAVGVVVGERGYAGATLSRIADAAGVSVETVKAQGSKHTLLVHAFERAFTGHEDVHTFREWDAMQQPRSIPGLEGIVAMVAVTTAGFRRSARLYEAFVSAGRSDPEVAAELDALIGRRHADVLRALEDLAARGVPVVGPADRDRAVHEMVFVMSHEGWVHFVERCGWTDAQYVDWTVRQIVRVVGPQPGPPGPPGPG